MWDVAESRWVLKTVLENSPSVGKNSEWVCARVFSSFIVHDSIQNCLCAGFYYFNFRSETIHELVVAELHYHPPRKETLIPHLEVSPICTLSSQ